MKTRIYLMMFLLFLIAIHPDLTLAQGNYFNQNPPGSTAEIFAPGSISLSNRFENGITFSPDGKILCFSSVTTNWAVIKIYCSRETGGVWQTPQLAEFSMAGQNTDMCFTVDNQLLFASNRNSGSFWNFDSWMTGPDSTSWLTPQKLSAPVNSAYGDWFPQRLENGTIYFSSERPGGKGSSDIWYSILEDGEYKTVQNVGSIINTSGAEYCPYVSPDESFMIFQSERAGGVGSADLYISFRNADNTWTAPQNLGPKINSTKYETTPFVTFDKEYLFFSRKDAWQTFDIYWVDAGFIDSLKSLTGIENKLFNRPESVELFQNFPNPFNPQTLIKYNLSNPGIVRLTIYDLTGRELETLVNGDQSAGEHAVAWQPDALPSGIYFYRIQIDGFAVTRKLILQR